METDNTGAERSAFMRMVDHMSSANIFSKQCDDVNFLLIFFFYHTF